MFKLTQEMFDKYAVETFGPGSFNVLIVNETALDRSRQCMFSLHNKVFNSIAEYVFFQKMLSCGVPEADAEKIRSKYVIVYPMRSNIDEIPYEANAAFNLQLTITDKWREKHPFVIADAVVALYEQDRSFKTALDATKKTICAELSSSLYYGADSNFSNINTPSAWIGKNTYGQVLVAVREHINKLSLAKAKSVLNKRIF